MDKKEISRVLLDCDDGTGINLPKAVNEIHKLFLKNQKINEPQYTD